jgi:hypothetical protein
MQCSHACKLKQISIYKIISHTILNTCNEKQYLLQLSVIQQIPP